MFILIKLQRFCMTGGRLKLLVQVKNTGQAGFSLLEMVVALFIFSIITLSATAIFQMAVEAQRSSLAAQNIQTSLRYALEVMSKEIRNAQRAPDASCAPLPAGYIYYETGGALYFLNKHHQCVEYALNTLEHRIEITRIGASHITKPITPASVKVNKMEFKVLDNGSANVQARVTILIEAEVAKGKYKQPLTIQTTVSSRYYN